jgi:hypothetical protein
MTIVRENNVILNPESEPSVETHVLLFKIILIWFFS